jgi:hypothetical protein
MECPWGCGWQGTPEEYLSHYEQCPAKSGTPAISTVPILDVDSIIHEAIDSAGNIVYPKVKSPLKEFDVCTGGRQTDSMCLIMVLKDLVVAERVDRRQYEELLQIKEFAAYAKEIMHIRDEEIEHEQILTKMLDSLGYKIQK